ncbi:RING finger domain protein [Aspergillus floccosus]
MFPISHLTGLRGCPLTRRQDSATFHFVLDGTIQTLSTQNTPDTGPIKGLLFVPSLNPRDPCNNTTAPFIPANATRLQDVQHFGYQTIGLAPWVSDDCTKAYLNASGEAGSDALVFFVPSSNDTKPPGPDDPSWLLDGDDGWKSRAPFPVYAIPGTAGATLMQQLAAYGNNTDSAESSGTPFLQAPADTRLFTLIDLDRGDKKMPSLWGFILAIVGTILVLSILLLLCYQLVQKRRRENLQRRIEAGEADIENLGLHQMKVPQEVLDTIPVYTYPDVDSLSDKSSHRCADVTSTRSTDEIREPKDKRDDSSHCTASVCPEEDRKTDPNCITAECPKKQPDESDIQADIACPCPTHPNLTTASLPTELQPAARHPHRLSRSQTTCAICLDDFVPRTSTVRELPCGHIYHVECIDTSLTQNSSLCPLCKKCVLPPGCWSVPVTNTMVHRDHMLRRSLQ